MAFIITNGVAGSQPIATTSTVQNHATGKIVTARDPTLGEGEFIYLKGVASTIVGSVVTYVASTGATVLGTTSGVVNGGAPLAVAMSANVANQWGWYQIAGDATIKKTAVKVDPAGTTKVYLSATSGRVMQTSVAGRQVIGARWITATTVTSTTSTAIATLNRPVQQGAIT
jgi:hypothetical protein